MYLLFFEYFIYLFCYIFIWFVYYYYRATFKHLKTNEFYVFLNTLLTEKVYNI